MDQIVIYGLQRPGRDIFYVGKTNDLKRRLKEHRGHLKGQIEALVLEIVDASEWRAAEHAWIQGFRDAGLTISNRTEGGDGVETLSAELRAAISLRQKGRKHTPEARAKMSAKLKGRPKNWTLDGLERAAATRFQPGNNLWTTFSPEETEQHKQRMKDFNKTLSAEDRSSAAQKRVAKMDLAAIGEKFRLGWAKLTPEERSQRNRRAALAQFNRPGGRAHMSRMAKLFWARMSPEEKSAELSRRQQVRRDKKNMNS